MSVRQADAAPVLVDVGSSTTKTYLVESGRARLVDTVSVLLKEGFSPEQGLAPDIEASLIETFKRIQAEHGQPRLFGTAIFRKFDRAELTEFQERLKNQTGVTLEVIDQQREGRYLELALAGRYDGPAPILLINVGGGSTELVVLQNNQNIEEHHLDIGVGTVLSQFPEINGPLAGATLDHTMKFAAPSIPNLTTPVTAAILSGRELTYMRLADYPLKPNTLFEDPDHPSIIDIEGLHARNVEIYESVILAELESMMPENPTWMHGARAFVAIAEQICAANNITTIIPSDSNMVDGVVRAEHT